jgi:hypothetical protein
MKPEDFTKSLAAMAMDVKKFLEDDGSNGAPIVAGKTAEDFFRNNFQRQGFLDNGLTPWQDVKRRTNPRNTHRGRTAAGRKILFGETRNLEGGFGKDVRKGGVVVYNDTEYAPYHNEGTDKNPKAPIHGPQRRAPQAHNGGIGAKTW